MPTISDILKATGGKLLQGNPSLKIRGVTTNSRKAQKGDLFIAIVGDRVDAHDYIPQAVDNGAVAVVISRKTIAGQPKTVIAVDDTTKALGRIAAWHRQQFSIPVIAVTGSAGKTTTKELIAKVLKKKYKVLKNAKTENNQFGVPLTLLKMKKSYQVAVLELGTNRPGDIAWLTEITRPTTCVFTNIGDAHLEGLKTKGGVFKEKFQMTQRLPKTGHVIYNNDDRYLSTISFKKTNFRTTSYGLVRKADFQGSDLKINTNRVIQFKTHGRRFLIRTPARHNIYNALAAVACGRIYGVGYSDIQRALKEFVFGLSRQEFRKIGPLWIIDDTYNSNPVSFESAVDTLASLNARGRKVLICADMLELGTKAKILHERMGRFIAQKPIHLVLTIGEYSRYLYEGLKRANKGIQCLHCRSLQAVHGHLQNFCRPGDVLLVKGSRAMKMERTIDFLTRQFHSN